MSETKELRIESDCRVRLRNGWEGPVVVDECGDWNVEGFDGNYLWRANGQFDMNGKPHPLDIVAIIDEPDQPSIPPSESNGDEELPKAVVIDGPGEYIVSADGPNKEHDGAIARVERYSAYADPEYAWKVSVRSDLCWIACKADGTTSIEGIRILRKHAPSLETKPETVSLESGKWIVDASEDLAYYDGQTVNVVRGVALPDGRSWVAEFADGGRWMFFDNGMTSIHGLRLVRKVRPPRVEPYATDEEKGAMFGKTVRSTNDGQWYRVSGVSDKRVSLTRRSGAADCVSWQGLANEYTQDESDPCGTLIADDGTN